MSRHFDTAERRCRLGARHALAAPVATPEQVVDAVAALHSTDPASMTIGALARLAEPAVAEVERALYDDRSLVRILTMRRTVFVVPAALAGTYLSATRQSVAEPELRKLRAMIADSGIADPDAWLARAHQAALAAYERLDVFSSAELAAADPILATRIEIGAGTKHATRQSIASRLLTVTSAEGHAVRARPAGSWASTSFRWAAMRRWLPDLGDPPEPAEARAAVARRWLARFGPALPEDLQWTTGWTKGHTRAALAAVGAVEVSLDAGPGVVLPDDLDDTREPAPWVALLPALDPTTMGWRQREWHLGPHADQVFDAVGNAGPTLWCDGRVVGGWAVRDDGTIAMRLLEDVGREAAAALDERAHLLEALIDGVAVKARARRWTAVEKQLRG